jgi:hypothetical protein
MSAHEYARRQLTIEEYQQLPEEPGYRHELADGWLVREPQAGGSARTYGSRPHELTGEKCCCVTAMC